MYLRGHTEEALREAAQIQEGAELLLRRGSRVWRGWRVVPPGHAEEMFDLFVLSHIFSTLRRLAHIAVKSTS